MWGNVEYVEDKLLEARKNTRCISRSDSIRPTDIGVQIKGRLRSTDDVGRLEKLGKLGKLEMSEKLRNVEKVERVVKVKDTYER